MRKIVAVPLAAGTLALALLLTGAGDGTVEEEAAIREVVERAYVQGIHVLPDEAAIRAGFHPDFTMSVNDDEGLLVISLDTWLEHMDIGQRNDDPIEARFRMVDVTDQTAIAKVEIREAGEHIYTDYFGLYRMPDGWKIVNKIFQDHP